MDLCKDAYLELANHFRQKDPTHEHEDEIFTKLGYIDVKNLAHRIRGEVMMACGLMDTMVGQLRGIGYSIMPMIVSLTGACLLRIVWIMTIFAAYHTQTALYISYPISWLATFLVHMLCYMVVSRKIPKEDKAAA